MQYKTIVLGLVEQRPEIYDQLRSKRMLLSRLDFYSEELKASHEAWKIRLSQERPGSNESQIASEALEMALADLEAFLPPASPPDDNETPSLEGAMAFLRRHTPPVRESKVIDLIDHRTTEKPT